MHKYRSFAEFYPFYLSEHSGRTTRTVEIGEFCTEQLPDLVGRDSSWAQNLRRCHRAIDDRALHADRAWAAI